MEKRVKSKKAKKKINKRVEYIKNKKYLNI